LKFLIKVLQYLDQSILFIISLIAIN